MNWKIIATQCKLVKYAYSYALNEINIKGFDYANLY